MEFKKGNTFGTLAFLSYGLFWLSFAGLVMIPSMDSFSAFAPEAGGMVAYLVMWGLFTFGMFFSTLKANRALQFVFLSLTILFFLLAIAEGTGIGAIGILAGIEGILCGASAIYLAIAEVTNEAYGKVVLPVWPVKKE